jgi:hypothetical protein
MSSDPCEYSPEPDPPELLGVLEPPPDLLEDSELSSLFMLPDCYPPGLLSSRLHARVVWVHVTGELSSSGLLAEMDLLVVSVKFVVRSETLSTASTTELFLFHCFSCTPFLVFGLCLSEYGYGAPDISERRMARSRQSFKDRPSLNLVRL